LTCRAVASAKEEPSTSVFHPFYFLLFPFLSYRGVTAVQSPTRSAVSTISTAVSKGGVPLHGPGRTRPADRSPGESHPKKAAGGRSERAPPPGQCRFRSAPAPYRHRYRSRGSPPSLRISKVRSG